MPDRQQPLSPTKLLALIMGALALWGVYIAIGSYLYNRNPWRPLIVLASVGIFLGIWMLLLWGQSRRQRKS
jgi:hypothetical protein